MLVHFFYLYDIVQRVQCDNNSKYTLITTATTITQATKAREMTTIIIGTTPTNRTVKAK